MSRLIKEGPSRGENDFMQEIVDKHNPGPDDPVRPARHGSGGISILWAIIAGAIVLVLLAALFLVNYLPSGNY